MERLLAMLLLMSLFTVSCNKSDDTSSTETTDSTSAPVEGTETPTDATPDTGTGANPTTPVPTAPTPTTPTPTPTPTPTTSVPLPQSSLPSLALTFKTNVSYLSGFDSNDITKYEKAVALVKKVVATEAFRNAVLNHTYDGVKQFVQSNGLTNAQVYQTILDAAEKLTPAKNNTLDVGVKLYYENNNVVGYTSTGITYINVNTKYFDTYAINSVASNLFHEWLHKVGYGHDSSATARRPYSVPYAVGYMIRDIGRNFL